jgi:predicted acylesterase/phospholipase RssA
MLRCWAKLKRCRFQLIRGQSCPEKTQLPHWQQHAKISFLNDDGSLNLDDKRVVLLLQGGGALGAYQVGAYEALAAALAAKNIKIDCCF